MPPLSPPADTFVPTIEIAVNHAPLPPTTAKLIVDLSVTQLLEPPNSFSFRLNDPTLELIDPRLGIFKEGSRVEISLGYVGNTTKLLVGEIAALSLDLPSDGPATAQVEGFDLLHRLHRLGYVTREWRIPDEGRRRRYYAISEEGLSALAEHKRQWVTVTRALGDAWGGVDLLPSAFGWA